MWVLPQISTETWFTSFQVSFSARITNPNYSSILLDLLQFSSEANPTVWDFPKSARQDHSYRAADRQADRELGEEG